MGNRRSYRFTLTSRDQTLGFVGGIFAAARVFIIAIGTRTLGQSLSDYSTLMAVWSIFSAAP